MSIQGWGGGEVRGKDPCGWIENPNVGIYAARIAIIHIVHLCR